MALSLDKVNNQVLDIVEQEDPDHDIFHQSFKRFNNTNENVLITSNENVIAYFDTGTPNTRRQST